MAWLCGRTAVRPECARHGLSLVICKEVTGNRDGNRSEPQGGCREANLKEAASKGATVGIRIGSEAGHGR